MPGPVRKVIEIRQSLIGPVESRTKSVRARRVADYPQLAPGHRDLVEAFSSPLFLGPPVCDELVALVQHVFTEQEAEVARHLGRFRGRTAEEVARSARRPASEVAPILKSLATGKRCILASGSGEKRRYTLLPVIPGMFEVVLIGHVADEMSEWHRRFAELIEAIYETGFCRDYMGAAKPMVRYLPVAGAVEGHPMALPSDCLEAVLDRYDVFGVGECQCRTSAAVVGHACDRPRGNCLLMGDWARAGLLGGSLKSVSREGALELKREAESSGLVTWMMNVDSPQGQCSCSCCGCCCKMLRTVNEFNAPGAIAPPHFFPAFDASRCSHCGKCALNCPMGAITVDTRGKRLEHAPERCVGCGLCALACRPLRAAITMEAVPRYRVPYRSWFSLLLESTPRFLGSALEIWRDRSR